MVEEYRRQGKNSSWVDKRIGEGSSKMTEDEKMKMRYLREQKEHARESLLGNDRHLSVNMSRKRNKFNLASDDESDDQDVLMGGFTHKGRKLGDFDDDFNEKVELSSEDEEDGGRRDKGKLTDEMVRGMNFGGGDLDEYAEEDGQQRKKTRKEVFDEIIEKSKAWNAAK